MDPYIVAPRSQVPLESFLRENSASGGVAKHTTRERLTFSAAFSTSTLGLAAESVVMRNTTASYAASFELVNWAGSSVASNESEGRAFKAVMA